MKKNLGQAKVGEGHLQAMVRLALKELRNAANPSKESVADNEVGLYGTATQMEVNQEKGVTAPDPEQAKPKQSLSDLRKEVEKDTALAKERDENGKEPEVERD